LRLVVLSRIPCGCRERPLDEGRWRFAIFEGEKELFASDVVATALVNVRTLTKQPIGDDVRAWRQYVASCPEAR
jgi:hypothetical protein